MPSIIRMPQMGVSDESAILSKWLVREGDHVRRGQAVFSLETDKATFQYESERDGILVRILTGEGEEAAVGSPVGILSGPEEIFEETGLEALLRELKTPDTKPQVHAEHQTNTPQEAGILSAAECCSVQEDANGKQRFSPRARKKADELHVNLGNIRSGSGPEGRILERDVLNFFNRSACETTQKTAGIYSGRPLTQADRINMRSADMEAAGRSGFVSKLIDARSILARCTPRNGLAPGTVICHELARLLVQAPELNARHHGDRIYEYNTVHLRLTADTPVCTLRPVIRCAETYTVDELAVLMRNAAGRCRFFASKPQEFQEGTFSVTDLSEYGADCFTPELTPPELCALGIGAVTMQTNPAGRGGNELYPAIRLTLVYDRTGIDTLHAAKFLNELALRLEPDAANIRKT